VAHPWLGISDDQRKSLRGGSRGFMIEGGAFSTGASNGPFPVTRLTLIMGPVPKRNDAP